MGLITFLRQIFKKKPKEELLEALNQSEINLRAIEQQSIEQSSIRDIEPQKALESSIELEKDSLQLGIAAGYTGRSLKEIESSLNRIETQMTTKEWFTLQLKDHLIEAFKQHEENEQKRFEIIQHLLLSLQKTAEKALEPIKTDLIAQIKSIEGQLPLSRRMQQIIDIVKEAGEISYMELGAKLGISGSALRGLLSLMAKRTSNIQRFEKDGKGWLRYITLD